MDKTYQPERYEAEIYRRWEDSGAFAPNPSAPKEPFTIIMPPPNANGDLHLGHAMYVVEDIIIRYRRMLGHKTLWLPGADHAGIETQVVYERLLQQQGKSRFDLGPEEFYRQVWDFTRSNLGKMTDQIRQLGFSVDWSRLKFTLDDDIVATVYDTFKRLHNAGHIYRANRIINWCPHCRSAFADIEIKYREQLDPLYYIKYGPFVLATVRPETKFGDTAIAVNPADERYAKYVGQTIEAEDLNGPIKLKVIADDYVNPEFGTGVVKVTPAHDPNDWEMGQRHNLEVKQVIGTDGLLTELAGRYAGMPVAEARAQVAHDLEERDLIDHIDESYSHNVGYHERCGTLIEPLVIEQWWLRVDELKMPAIEAIRSGEITFTPSRFKKVALDWLDNLHDWNISRQNWWGSRIPVYYSASSDRSKPEYIIGTEAEAITTYGEGNYEAETDNFDTWFSSGQWPFATLMATGDFDKGFYPTSVMETGRDILFLWVTRMIMLGLFRTGQVPFRQVYLHGLITDAHGAKMSKSKGNVINPLEMTARYGTDALRLALTIGITPGNDGSVSEEKIQGYRNFGNKLWNVARFILGQLPPDYSPAPPAAQTAADEWILAKLNNAVIDITRALEAYHFSEAGQLAYSLLWDDFADWYVEAAKAEPNTDLLVYGLETILKLLHPLAPFVSEAIWSQLPWQSSQLISESWPVANKKRTEGTEFEALIRIVSMARALQAELSLQQITIVHPKEEFWVGNGALISRLIPGATLKEGSTSGGLILGSDPHPAWLEAGPKMLDLALERLAKNREEKRKYLHSLESQLENKNYLKSAPEPVVADTRRRREETLMLLSKLDEQIRTLET